MADVEDPARIATHVAGHRRFYLRPRDDLGIDRLLNETIVEEACLAIAVAIHCHQADRSGRRIERLGEPARIARDFVGSGSAGHASS